MVCHVNVMSSAAYMWADLHYQDARGRLAGKLVPCIHGILRDKLDFFFWCNSSFTIVLEGNI